MSLLGSTEQSKIRTPSSEQAEKDDERPTARRGRRRPPCEACARRDLKCRRKPGQDICMRCIKMSMNCVPCESRKAVTTIFKMSAAAGTEDPKEVFPLEQNHQNPAKLPFTISPKAQNTFAAFMDSGLISRLISTSSLHLRLAALPLMHQVDIQQEYTSAGSLLNMEPASQAFFMGVAALAARYVSPKELDNLEAPTLGELSQNPSLRHESNICVYGKRRERSAQVACEMAIKSLHESNVFTEPSVRSVAALALMEFLAQAIWYPCRTPSPWDQRARLCSAAAAGHLRSLAEAHLTSGSKTGPYFRSSAWICIINDLIAAISTGRSLHYTSDDLRLILGIDENNKFQMPDAHSLIEVWLNERTGDAYADGPFVKDLLSVFLQHGRAFVNKVSSPLPTIRSEFNTTVMENLLDSFHRITSLLHETRRLAEKRSGQRTVPYFAKILWHSMDHCILQAHKALLRHHSRNFARQWPSGPDYLVKLRSLQLRSHEEVFWASQRRVSRFVEWLKVTASGTCDYFLPGYFVLEDIPSWVEVVTQTKHRGELGGRPDYPLSKKLADLRILRDSMAFLGWSYGDVQPLMVTLGQTIAKLEAEETLRASKEALSVLSAPATKQMWRENASSLTDNFGVSYLGTCSTPASEASSHVPAGVALGNLYPSRTGYQLTPVILPTQNRPDSNTMSEMMSSEWMDSLFKHQ